MSGKYERELIKKINEQETWIAHRATGSMGECDVSAHRVLILSVGLFQEGYIFEIKSSRKDKVTMKLNDHHKEQWEHYKGLVKQGFPNVLFACRFKRGEQQTRWQFYPVSEQLDKEYPHIFRRGEGYTFEETFKERDNE